MKSRAGRIVGRVFMGIGAVLATLQTILLAFCIPMELEEIARERLYAMPAYEGAVGGLYCMILFILLMLSVAGLLWYLLIRSLRAGASVPAPIRPTALGRKPVLITLSVLLVLLGIGCFLTAKAYWIHIADLTLEVHDGGHAESVGRCHIACLIVLELWIKSLLDFRRLKRNAGN